jgi:fumarylpyruvate hydrolase
MTPIFPPRPPVLVPIHGQATGFPVRRIYCVGRNYADHAREMGSDPAREPPFFFAKDADAVALDGATIPYPPVTQDYHHEVELVVAIGQAGFQVSEAAAEALIFGYAVGLDMTRRDLQSAARGKGQPWSVAKNFPASAPVGAIHPIAETGALRAGAITLRVNGGVRQSGDLRDLIWNVPATLAALSTLYRLLPGDLVFTGTPAGVGPVLPGDVLVGAIDGLGTLTVTVGPAEA